MAGDDATTMASQLDQSYNSKHINSKFSQYEDGKSPGVNLKSQSNSRNDYSAGYHGVS